MNRKLILLELNEVPFRLLDRYRELKPQSILSELLAGSQQYRTIAADRIALDPWISWPTLHRGVNDEVHGIYHLGQESLDVDVKYPPIWRILSKRNLSVGVFGSLHSSQLPDDIRRYSFYLPDYFGTSVYSYPPQLIPFQQLNLAMTRESARNVTRRIPIKSLLHFAASIPALGVRVSTLADTALQLARECSDKALRIRRRAYQPLIMMDIFIKQLQRSKPDFATFYTNHVAAAMHRYWGAFFPEDYSKGQLDESWITRYQEEIPFSMDKLDTMLGRLKKFVECAPNYLLMVASSMGQAAIPTMQTSEFLTITDPGRFMSALGVPAGSWELRPAMVPCCCIAVESTYQRRVVEEISKWRVEGSEFCRDKRPVGPLSYDARENGFFQFFVQFDNYSGSKSIVVDGKALPLEDAGLGMMAHEDGVNCTAQHVPEGSLWIYDPLKRKQAQAAERQDISVLDVAPSIMAMFGLEKSSYMRGSLSLGLNA